MRCSDDRTAQDHAVSETRVRPSGETAGSVWYWPDSVETGLAGRSVAVVADTSVGASGAVGSTPAVGRVGAEGARSSAAGPTDDCVAAHDRGRSTGTGRRRSARPPATPDWVCPVRLRLP